MLFHVHEVCLCILTHSLSHSLTGPLDRRLVGAPPRLAVICDSPVVVGVKPGSSYFSLCELL